VNGIPLDRDIFCNRTLNLRSIRAIGYDLDYTLVHYHTDRWEGRVYEHAKARLAGRGWPVEGLTFDPRRMIQGLTIDLEHGNLIKATRFGYVIRAAHGSQMLSFDELRRTYAGTVVDLSEDRWVFLNTLFSLSESTLFAQVVDLADAGAIGEVVGYEDLYRSVREALDSVHAEGRLKQEIASDPDRFIDVDADTVAALRDQRDAGKQLLLITNSEWEYAGRMLAHVVDPYMDGGTWRDLFDVVIVSSDKPRFFSGDQQLYRMVDEERALLRPHRGPIEAGSVYFGGCAARVEESLGLSGDEILYVGDHLFGDVHASKSTLRWRTALVMRELEDEIAALRAFAKDERRLTAMMTEKESLEWRLAESQLSRQRRRRERRRGTGEPRVRELDRGIEETRAALARLDEEIAPLAIAAGSLNNPTWGLLMRAGADKSLFARQVERYADVYTSRVSNFLHATPNAFLRAHRSPLPHDVIQGPGGHGPPGEGLSDAANR
jgi:5'-nucleotidase